MSFRVCEENLNEAQDEALRTLQATRSGRIEAARFNWLYRDNPDGPAVLWSVRSEKTSEMAGFTVALPRRVLVGGREQLCWNGADFSIHQKFRTLGTALKLRRAAKEGIDAGRAAFLYAHPNAKMQIIHEKVGHQPVGVMIRMAKVLRSEGHIRRRFGRRALPSLTGGVVDVVLRLVNRESRHRATCGTRVVSPAQFDIRFDQLFADAAPGRAIVGVRDSKYLHWRYALNPLYETHAVLAEQGGKLLGYALYTMEDHVAHLKDLFTVDEKAVARDLLAALIHQARRTRLIAVSAVILEHHPMAPLLAEFGFSRRPETSLMFGYAPETSCDKADILNARSWFVSVGDRDV